VKPGDHGEAVSRLQQALRAAADPLPRYGSDGHFGGETSEALTKYCEGLGVSWSGGAVPMMVLAQLGLADRSVPPAPAVQPRIYDLRLEAADPHPKARTSNGRTTKRDFAKIEGVVLHQTAAKFGQPRGDPTELGLARRALRVACHGMAFDGLFVLAAPLDWHIYHADGFNPTTLGLELDGNFPGLLGGPSTNSRPVTPMTDGLVASAREGLRALVEEGRKLGAPVRYIYAHRQADSWRRADPGEEAWQRIVLEYAVPVLGLLTRPLLTLPDPQRDPKRRGLAIPVQWDPAGKGQY